MNTTIKTKLLLATGLFLVFVVIAILIIDSTTDRSEPLEWQAFELTQTVVGNAEVLSENELGYINASIISGENFQITYQEEVERFTIYINTGGRDAEHFLTEEEVIIAREDAEKYFIEEVLKTEDLDLICELNVRVTTSGYGFALDPSPLTVCQ